MKKIDRNRALKYIGIVLVIGITLFVSINTAEAKKLVGYAITILLPFIYGFCIAFVLNLLVKQFESIIKKIADKKGKQVNIKKWRVTSIIVSLVVVIAFVSLVVGMIIPNLKETISSLYKQAPELWDKFIDWLDKFKDKQPRLAEYITKIEKSLDGYASKLTSKLKNNSGNLISTAVDKIKSASNTLFNFGIGAIIAFGILVKKEELVTEFDMLLKKLLPPVHYQRTRYVLKLANKKFQIFLKFDLVQAVITGAGTFLFMLVTGMPYKVSISLLITVTQLVPVIGAILGTAISAILVAAVNPVKAIIFVVLCILVQQLVEKLINPHLMGKELELPGILTFLAVVLGGKQFGLVGLICAVPFVSVCYDIYTQKLRPKLKENSTKND